MKTRWLSFKLACLAITGVSILATATSGQSPEDEAQKAAESWLDLVDSGKYPESWDEAAAFLKGAMPRDRWIETMNGARSPLGKRLSRKIKSRQYTEQVPGAPDGKYVIVQFDSAFEKKASAVETVTPVLDGERGWRVSGYFIK